MEENERMDNIEELESNEAIETPAEASPAAATELGQLTNEVREELPAEESFDDEEDLDEDEEDDDEESAARPDKIGFGAWLAAIGVFLFALAAFVPALWNTQLTLSAVKGLSMEAQRRYSSASDAYSVLAAQDQTAQQWSAENFSFGSSEAPVFSSGNFVLQRFAFLIDKLNGPYSLQQFMTQYPYFNPEGTLPRYPRYLKPALAKVDALDAVSQLINDAIDPSYDEADPGAQAKLVLDAIRSVRKNDANKAYVRFCDAIELDQISYADPTSKEAGELISALKKAPGSESWMYVGAEYTRARAMEDHETLADIFSHEFTRNREDYSALANWAKALHLTGNTKLAQKLIKQYDREESAIYIQVLQAELLIREGKYDEAVKLCDAALKNAPSPASETTPQTVQGDSAMELVAHKGAALLLQENAQEALDLLRNTLDEPYGKPGTNYLGTTLAAAALTGDAEYLNWMLEQMQMAGYEIPEEIQQLQKKTITLKEIYTTGWGGF